MDNQSEHIVLDEEGVVGRLQYEGLSKRLGRIFVSLKEQKSNLRTLLEKLSFGSVINDSQNCLLTTLAIFKHNLRCNTTTRRVHLSIPFQPSSTLFR